MEFITEQKMALAAYGSEYSIPLNWLQTNLHDMSTYKEKHKKYIVVYTWSSGK